MKRKDAKKTKIEGFRPELPTERPETAAPQPPPTPEEQAKTDQSEELNGLPSRDLIRVDEVALYLGKAVSTIRLWIDHGYFKTEKFRGSLWVTRESIVAFRLKNRVRQ